MEWFIEGLVTNLISSLLIVGIENLHDSWRGNAQQRELEEAFTVALKQAIYDVYTESPVERQDVVESELRRLFNDAEIYTPLLELALARKPREVSQYFAIFNRSTSDPKIAKVLSRLVENLVPELQKRATKADSPIYNLIAIESLQTIINEIRMIKDRLSLQEELFPESEAHSVILTTSPSRKDKLIFLAYAMEDEEFANHLSTDLGAKGLKPWIDQVGLIVRTSYWEEAIRDALKRADAVLLIASPNLRHSDYILDELAIAKGNHKPIYCLWISGDEWIDTVPVGIGLSNTEPIDARGDKYSSGVEKLINRLSLLKNAVSIQAAVAHHEPKNFVPRNPYKGLKAFHDADKKDFFGRESLVTALVNQVSADPCFLGVIGASGSGKSSLIMAGLLPHLRNDPKSEGWSYLELIPGKEPLEALSTELAKHLPKKSHAAIKEDLLDKTTRGLDRLARQITSSRLVLYIDQFEELFTQTEKDAERLQFIHLITTAAKASNNVVTIILTLRADFYDRVLAYPTLGELIEKHRKAILPLAVADLYDVILKPAAQPDVQLMLEPGLTEEMVFSVKGEAGSLPLLQFTLEELFQRREGLSLTREAYNNLGGVRGALAKRAEDTYQSLNDEGKELARRLFLRLIEPGTTEQDTTRRRASLDELKLVGHEETDLLGKVKDEFVNARLLTAQQDTIEVIHEALVREWSQLAAWLRTEREDILLQQSITRDAKDWVRKGKNEDDLYGKSKLSDALAWSKRNKPSSEEMEFIQASERAEEARVKSLLEAEAELSQSQKLSSASRLINTSQNLEDLVLVGNVATNSPDTSFWLALLEGRSDTGGWTNHIRIISKLEKGVVEVTNEVHPLILPSDSPLREYKPATIIDMEDEENTTSEQVKWLRRMGISSMVIFPLRSDNVPIGLFYVVSAQPYDLSSGDYEVYTALTEQMGTQIQNRKLLNETSSLYGITTNISRAQDLEGLTRAIETALSTLHPDMMACYLQSDSASQSIERLFSIGFDMTETAGVDLEELVSLPIPYEYEETVYIPDLSSNTPTEITFELLKDDQIQAFAIISLRVKNITAARLMVGYRRPFTFGEDVIRFITSISDSASVVLNNLTLLEQLGESLQETSLLYQASRSLIEATDPSEVINVITSYLAEPHMNQVFLAQLNTTSWHAPNATIEIPATWRSGSEVDLQGVKLTADQFPAWRLLAAENVLVIQDIYSEDSKLNEFERISIEAMDTRSLVIIPLRVGGRAIGAIWLSSQQPHAYTEQNIRVFQAFAEQTSLSMDASRSLAEAERRARQLETSANISRNISELLDLDVLLSRVVDLIRDTFRYDHVQVFLIDEKSHYAVLRASTGDAGRRLLGRQHRIAIGAEGVVGQVALTGRPTIALDTADVGIVHLPDPDLPYTRCNLGIPLIIKERIVGVLDVQSNVPNDFTDQDIQALTTLAAQISVAIGNAQLMKAMKDMARKSDSDPNI